jgi:hypothetical protein
VTHIDPDEILRRELRAAAESIEPAADGLNQIRARLSAPRPLAVAWFMVGWTTVGQPALARLGQVFEPVAERLRPALHPVASRLRLVLGKLRVVFTPRTGPGGRRSRYAWLRPALTMAAVVAVVVVGSFALAGLPHGMISQVGEVFGNQTHSSHGGGRPPRENGNGQPIPTPGSGNRAASPSPSASCSPSPKPTPTPTPTPTPSSPSPTPTPTPTPSSPSPTPTPTPTPTASGGGDTPPSPGSQSAEDTSLVVIASSAHSGLVAKPRPSPSPTCTPRAG